MLAVLTGAQLSTEDGTGARLGRWVDGNFVWAVGLGALACLLLLVAFALLVRGYGRQRRRNRRMRRQQEGALHRQVEVLQAKIDELRGDVRQLGELEDHVVGQLSIIRERLDAGELMGPWEPSASTWRSSAPGRPSSSEPASSSPPTSVPVPVSAGGNQAPRSAQPAVSLTAPVPTASPSPAAGVGQFAAPPAPAMLVETGEPLAWSTRQN